MRTIATVSATLLLVGAAIPCFAEVPRVITFQGHLAGDGDNPVDLTMSFYDTASGGTLLFEETHFAVPRTEGLFTIQIGSQTAGGLPDSALDAIEVWLGITVNDGVELTPRIEISMAPFAAKAGVAEGLVKPGTFESAVNVDVDGRVGIGTTNPTAPLEVAGQTKTDSIAIWNDAGTVQFLAHCDDDDQSPFGKAFVLRVGGSGFNSYPIQLGRDEANNIVFIPGSVGIGTMTPGAKLTVSGSSIPILLERSGRESWALHQTSNGGNGLGFYNVDDEEYRLFLTEAGNVGIGTPSPNTKLTVAGTIRSTLGGIMFPDGTVQDSASSTSLWQDLGSGNLSYDGDVFIGGGAGEFDSGSESLVIRAESGTWYVGAQNESSEPATDFFIGLGSTEDGIFHIQRDGNVGIGTASPAAPLDVASSSGVPSIVTRDGKDYAVADGQYFDIGSWDGSAFTQWMVITPDGDAGIGVSAPAAKLDVAGGIAISGLQIVNSQGHWVGDPTGLQGPQGPTGPQGPAGPQGPPGPAVSTSAICTPISGAICSYICDGSIVAGLSAPCFVTSDTGSCELTGQSGVCCVCAP